MSKIINQIEKIKDEENKISNLIAKSLHKSYINGEFLSLKDIADECYVSQSTVTVFAKRLGCSGYRELIMRLKMESDNLHGNSFAPTDDFDLFLEFQNSTIATIKDGMANRDDIIKASMMIRNADKVMVAGSPQVGKDAQYFQELLSVKRNNIILFSRELSNYMLDKIKTIKKGDTVILIVAGQETSIEVEIFEAVSKLDGVNIIVFTSESQVWKFPRKDREDILVMSIDSNHLPHQPVFRKLQLNYLFLEMFLLV
ncbi:MurR/RpiR family transcriptional regulator [[Acholeplasma] multilocale]|uniref:MurR/RpiR family transcriptional regulator n=1 Tax=[Acholeplasma] multilocale TaxID=264638 RepID=UPI0004796492|nr:MurR/RpiR family transcriptional regulator [[Acholeplasma] multilocale]